MHSVIPILVQLFNQNIIIPGIEYESQIASTFFFIICQKEGRNELNNKMKLKQEKFIILNEKEIQEICS